MINFNDFNSLINNTALDSILKSQINILVKPCFDFREYLKNKYGISFEDIENIIQLKISIANSELTKGLELLDVVDYTYLIISRMSRIISNFAQDEGFEDYYNLEISLKRLLIIGVKNKIKFQNNGKNTYTF